MLLVVMYFLSIVGASLSMRTNFGCRPTEVRYSLTEENACRRWVCDRDGSGRVMMALLS